MKPFEPEEEAKKTPKEYTVYPERYDHFPQDERYEAFENARKLVLRRESNDMALESLITRNKRKSLFITAVLPEALRAIEYRLDRIHDEVQMLRYDLDNEMYRRREFVRLILSRGRTVSEIQNSIQLNMPQSLSLYFEMAMVYLINYRRLFRLSAVVLEAFATMRIVPHPEAIGNAFHLLASERLEPYNEDAKHIKRARLAMEAVAKSCTKLMVKLSDRENKYPLQIKQPTIYLLAKRLPVSTLTALYHHLINKDIYITEFTALHIVQRLVEPDKESGISQWRPALEILKSMKYRRNNLNTEPALRIFYKTIYQAIREGDQPTTEEILRLMAECKLEPGVEVYNMLMSKASESNDETAMRQYFDAITTSGMQPNMVTYAISHTFYKRNREERKRELVVNEAYRLDPNFSLFIATDILHAAVLQRRPWFEVYQRFANLFHTSLITGFNIAPERRLGTYHISLPDKKKLEPDHVTLAVMLTSYANTEHSVQRIWDLYCLYRARLLDRRRTPAKKAMRLLLLKSGGYIPHIIMMGLGKHITGLPYLAAVLEDMLEPSAPIPSSTITWSIFIKFLSLAGKMSQAEEVLRVMRERGMEPTTITFTTLLDGYVKASQQPMAESVLERMQEAGQSPNVYTWTTLLNGYLKTRGNWKAGETFKRMLDADITPDEVTLQMLLGVSDKDRFEAGLSGDPECDEEMEEEMVKKLEEEPWALPEPVVLKEGPWARPEPEVLEEEAWARPEPIVLKEEPWAHPKEEDNAEMTVEELEDQAFIEAGLRQEEELRALMEKEKEVDEYTEKK